VKLKAERKFMQIGEVSVSSIESAMANPSRIIFKFVFGVKLFEQMSTLLRNYYVSWILGFFLIPHIINESFLSFMCT